MKRIDRSEYEKRVARIHDLFADMARHADEQATMRCPYKNRLDQCTARFGCRNKRPPRAEGEPPACASDDKLDYRSAWESDPDSFDEAKRQIAATASRGAQGPGDPAAGSVRHGADSMPAVAGRTIFDYADDLSVRVPTSCGRTGHCHECVVQINRGMEALNERTEAESFLGDNYRLACQVVVERPEHDVDFALLRRSPRILAPKAGRGGELDPAVTRRGDRVLYEGREIDEYRGRILGIALDVGTTTVVAELVDLEKGEPLYVNSFENPQRFGGSDVMNRISYDGGPYRGELHRAMINTFNTEIRELCKRVDISRNQIYEILVVGNATMRDLFFDLDVQSIGQKPYKSDVENEFREGRRDTMALNFAARKLGIYANRHARVFGPSLIASHVGADVAADLVAIDMAGHDDVVMLVDSGTNTEIVIGRPGRLMAASCPAGPAFEGGLVTYGMPGCDGAIESIRWKTDSGSGRFEYETIGDVEPEGICGSGLIDLLAELRRHDMMTPKGVFADGAKELSIVPQRGITLSRRDASELAQAKAANYCGQIILMRLYGVTPQQISRLYLAGGFANYVDPDSAVDIGFLAPVPRDRVVKVGNAAAQGARELLLSTRKRRSIEQLVRSIEHVELETTPDFFDMFVDGCQFKPMVVPEG